MPSALPAPVALLRSARLPDGGLVDVEITGETVSAVVPAGSGETTGLALDLEGHLLLPAAAEPHAHLDKALTFDAIRPPLGDLPSAIAAFHAFAEQETEQSIRERARAVLLRMLANGVTAVRSHVNFYSAPDPSRGARALIALRDEFAGLIDLELVALPGWDTPDEAVEQALDLGVDLVGGAPHLAPDALADLGRLLDLAERRGAGVDLHTDESLSGPLTLGAYAERVAGWRVPKSAGHCVRLGTLGPAELAPIVDAVLAADIGVIGLPITNLYLQGWDDPVSTPRGLTALQALIDAGVRVAAGADNVRDPFNPVGRCDPLETASLLVTAGHLGFEEAIGLVTAGARDVLGLPPAGPVVGARADLLAVRGDSIGEVVAFAPADRIVLHRGRLVSLTTTITTTASPTREASAAGVGSSGRTA